MDYLNTKTMEEAVLELEPMDNDGFVPMSEQELEQSELEELEYWLDRQSGDK